MVTQFGEMSKCIKCGKPAKRYNGQGKNSIKESTTKARAAKDRCASCEEKLKIYLKKTRVY